MNTITIKLPSGLHAQLNNVVNQRQTTCRVLSRMRPRICPWTRIIWGDTGS